MATRDDFDITVERSADVVRVGTRGEIDILTAGRLEARIAEASRGTQHLLLDFGDVTFMDSSGVHILLGAMRDASLHDRRLTFASEISAPVERILAVTGVLARLRNGHLPRAG